MAQADDLQDDGFDVIDNATAAEAKTFIEDNISMEASEIQAIKNDGGSYLLAVKF